MHVGILKNLNDIRIRWPYIFGRIQVASTVFTVKQTIPFTCSSMLLSSSVASQDGRSLRDIIATRKQQAKHSVLVELPTSYNCSRVNDLLSSSGQVKKIIDWKNFNGKTFSLVEFYESGAVQALFHKCNYRGPRNGLPTFSRILYHKNLEQSFENNTASLGEPHSQDSEDLRVTNSFTENSFVSEQVNAIYQKDKLKDIHIRLRFIMCAVLEDVLRGIFPYCKFVPVGSTVDGFGNHRSDLNLFLAVNPKPDMGNSRFCYPTKKMLNSYNNIDSHILSSVGDILDTFLPGVSDVKKNMLSTPPVVKFQHSILGLSCSLTISDMPSLFMSELMFLCGEIDSHVKPLVFTVKNWAYSAKITRSYDGTWVTNFALTLMVIFFLQTRPHPVLPPLDEVQHRGMANDFQGQNEETIDSLLKEFFYFLCSFQFKSKSISISDAQALTKPDFSPLYIQNPVDRQLNLCRNVTQQQLDHLTEVANSTFWNLETISHHNVIKDKNLLELLLANAEQEITVKC